MVSNIKNMDFLEGKIVLNKELSDLDKFTLDFIKVLQRHTNYVLISGYVSILLGRSRMSEDVDVIIPALKFEKFKELLKELFSYGFYCLNADTDEKIYEYVTDKIAVRFAKKGEVIPNMELKFSKCGADELALQNRIEVELDEEKLFISSLELQIAYKEEMLKSPKDLEDALHLRIIAEGKLDLVAIDNYKRILNE